MKTAKLAPLLLLLAAPIVLAQEPPVPQPRVAIRTLANPEEMRSIRTPDGIKVTLDAHMAQVKLYNPQSRKDDFAFLRTYNNVAVGPTIRMAPGDTLHALLKNNLPPDPDCTKARKDDHNTPNCFNITNLHTHGFHVSPSGNSDNVLLEIAPGETKAFQFDLPADHPAGTFWYHSHRHGDTAIQVSSGMEGALIVKGTRTYADRAKHAGLADIDTVLKQTGGKKVTERIALFQQIQYACDDNAANKWDCTGMDEHGHQRVGAIKDYTTLAEAWTKTGRYTSINGVVQPEIPVHAGQIYRWRLIHGGIRDTIGLRIARSTMPLPTNLLAAPPNPGATAEEQTAWSKKYCNLARPVPQFEFAVDGLTRTSISEKIVNILQPGYRSDVLTVFPEQGIYCVLDDALSPTSRVNGIDFDAVGRGESGDLPRDTRLLALIFVRGGAKIDTANLATYLGDELYKGNPELPAPVRDDLRQLKIAAFSPMHDLRPVADVGHITTTFDIKTPAPFVFMVDGKPFDHADPHPDHTLNLGTVDEWIVTSKLGGHPYHIHVNPFQIVRIYTGTDQNPVDIIDSGGHCKELDLATPDPQYCDMIGTFRDTIFVKKDYHIVIREKYEDYTGDFVMHCHILDHEDRGMMQKIRIQDPAHPDSSPWGGGGEHSHL